MLFSPHYYKNLKTVIVKTCLFSLPIKYTYSGLDKNFSTIGNTYNPPFWKFYKRKQAKRKDFLKKGNEKHHGVGLCSEDRSP